MTKKIEVEILEQDLRCIKKQGERTVLEGYVIIGFGCTKCHAPQEVRQNFPNEWTNTIYKCKSCDEKYLISVGANNPFTPRVGDSEEAEHYKKMIPFFQKTRGVQSQDEINLKM
ncbi:MAG: hypothetical protein PVJ67_05665 [Candidatus Pacearchaeota archaeon]|jgi:hypothetical protein